MRNNDRKNKQSSNSSSRENRSKAIGQRSVNLEELICFNANSCGTLH